MAYHTLFYAYNRLFNLNSFLKLSDEELSKRQQILTQMITPVIPSVERWWSIVQEERSPLWITILPAASLLSSSFNKKIQENQQLIYSSIKSLQLYPLDLISWGYHNTGRWDCVSQPYTGRDNPSEIQMKLIRPPQV